MPITLPPMLVPAIRNALVAQGFDPDAIADNGAIQPGGFFTSAFDFIELRSALWSGPLILPLRGPTSPAMQALIEQVQPDVLLRGPAGNYRYSPGGTPSGSPWAGIALGVAALTAGLGLTYYALKR